MTDAQGDHDANVRTLPGDHLRVNMHLYSQFSALDRPASPLGLIWTEGIWMRYDF